MVNTPGHDILSTGGSGGTLKPRFLWAAAEARESMHSHPAGGSYFSGTLIKVLGVLSRSAQTLHALTHSFRRFIYSLKPILGTLDQYLDVNNGPISAIAMEQWTKPIQYILREKVLKKCCSNE